VSRQAVLVEDVQVDPIESRVKTRAPHHVGYVEHAAIFEQWVAVFGAHGARYTLHAGFAHVTRLDAYEWSAAVQYVGAHTPPDGCTQRQDAVKDDAQHQPDQQQTTE
jgi:hypothetical protein